MKKVELIFVPTPGNGHLLPTVEFARRLLHQDDRISITILAMKWFSSDFVDTYVNPIVASHHDRVQVVELPRVDPPRLDVWESLERYVYAYLQSYVPPVRNAVRDIVSTMKSSSSSDDDDSTKNFGLVIDFFCSFMVDIATEFDLPAYIFLTASAAYLGLMLYLPIRHSQNSSEFETTDAEYLIPGFLSHPIPHYVLPSGLFDKQGGYTVYVKVAERFKDVKGIMVNTYEELEPYIFNYSSNRQCPPVYPVGPVIDINRQPHPELDLEEGEKVMKWLDDQPQSSVIFLCFGSMGSHDVPQVKEIVLGLEQSGCRFLWSLRVPIPTENKDASSDPQYDLQRPKIVEDILPEGFQERMRAGKGIICGWAPQVEVLGHKAIGGFVSHCGWNSILESLWFGVPIVAWPMYAEQQFNAYMLKELGLAVVLRLDYKKFGGTTTTEVVTADEIQKAIGEVMDGGSEVRKKVKEMAKMGRKAVAKGGSSFNSIGKLIEDLIGKD